MLAGCLLGPWRGFQAVLLFVVAAALGLPVLSGGRGGLAPFMSPSAGYLYGFAPAAFVTGWFMLMLPRAHTAGRMAANAFIASMAGGLVFLHLTGIIGLTIFADMTFDKAFLADLAFVPGDTIKALLCALIVHTVARALPDWPFPGSEIRTTHR
jgi:bioY protein